MNHRYLFGFALAAAGCELLAQWARIWSLAPDLAWGWALPLLIGYFLWSRWADRPARQAPGVGIANRMLQGSAILGALVLLPLSRLFLEPFPGWPLAEWIHSVVIVGLILALIAAWEGAPRARHFAWPLLFGLAALPWPAFVTAGAMGQLRIGLSSLVAGALNLLGEPARSSGTVIEVGSGFIGIDEACGGIRSLQTAVIVALTIGELRRDRWVRRLAWLGIGIALALVANVLRIGALALICARGGSGALEMWHDRVAVMEMAFTLGALALVALRAGVHPLPPREPAKPAASVAVLSGGRPPANAAAMAVFVAGIIALAEIGTLAWFGTGDRRAGRAADWAARLPAQLPSYTENAFTPIMQELLQCDAHQLGSWQDSSGARCAGYVIEWHRGHFAQYAVRLHNPDICLPLSGSELIAVRPPLTVAVGSFRLPFSVREFRCGNDTYHVYFLAWNVSAGRPLALSAAPGETSLSWFSRQWEEVRAGRRRLEGRLVALAVFDAADAADADRAFRSQIARMIYLKQGQATH